MSIPKSNSPSVSIILSHTSHPGNIGAVARAMKNMDLHKLILINPTDYPSVEATARASGADDVLQHARVVGSLDEALSDMQLVIGASARIRQLPIPLIDARTAARQVIVNAHLNVGLLFGNERTGLSNDELMRCHTHLHIPTNKAFSSLNLAMAVQVVAYEVRMAWLTQQQTGTPASEPAQTPSDADAPAPQAQMHAFYQQLEEAMTQVEFLIPKQSKTLMQRLHRLYNRAQLTITEANILQGFLSAIRRKLSG